MSALVCDRRHAHGADCYTPPEGDAPVTAVDVDALDKLREAATAGPWRTGGPGIVAGLEYIVTGIRTDADAALIVAAVNALPELLAEVRRGRALRDAVVGLAEDLDARWGDGFTDQAATRLRALLAAVDGGEQ